MMGRRFVPPIEFKCEWCREPFQAFARNHPKFCSRSCASSALAAKRDFSGSANPRFNGGLSTSPDGRTLIVHRDGSYSLYARALMEAHIGHELTFNEVVHHLNGDCTDDRIENLQVLTRAEHIEIHRNELLAGRGVLPGKWAIGHDGCVECGSTTRRHRGHGLCSACSSRRARAAAKETA